MGNEMTQRDAVWYMHHKGFSISQIVAATGKNEQFVRREILLRWAYDEKAPEGVNDGRDKHGHEQHEPSKGKRRA